MFSKARSSRRIEPLQSHNLARVDRKNGSIAAGARIAADNACVAGRVLQ
jgi:hypothetical protein